MNVSGLKNNLMSPYHAVLTSLDLNVPPVDPKPFNHAMCVPFVLLVLLV